MVRSSSRLALYEVAAVHELAVYFQLLGFLARMHRISFLAGARS